MRPGVVPTAAELAAWSCGEFGSTPDPNWKRTEPPPLDVVRRKVRDKVREARA